MVYTNQTIQIDTYTGHRITRGKIRIYDITKKDGYKIGLVNIYDQTGLLVRQIDRSWPDGKKFAYCTDWFFCDENGQRVRREFAEMNQRWADYISKSWDSQHMMAELGA